jgi:hypothetical protein
VTHRADSRLAAATGYLSAASQYEKLASGKPLGAEDKAYHVFALRAGATAAADTNDGVLAQRLAERAIAVSGERSVESLAALARGLELQGKAEEAAGVAKEAQAACAKVASPDADDRALAAEVDAILDRFAKSRPPAGTPTVGGV